MGKLKCVLCDGDNIVKQEDYFICQTCNCKYTLEEAKKIMFDSMETEKEEKKSDDDDLLKNLYELASNSYKSENYQQAENFCNQILTKDSTNYDAWLLKGKSINELSKPDNNRYLEAYNCIVSAYDMLNEKEKTKEFYEYVMVTLYAGSIEKVYPVIEKQNRYNYGDRDRTFTDEDLNKLCWKCYNILIVFRKILENYSYNLELVLLKEFADGVMKCSILNECCGFKPMISTTRNGYGIVLDQHETTKEVFVDASFEKQYDEAYDKLSKVLVKKIKKSINKNNIKEVFKIYDEQPNLVRLGKGASLKSWKKSIYNLGFKSYMEEVKKDTAMGILFNLVYENSELTEKDKLEQVRKISTLEINEEDKQMIKILVNYQDSKEFTLLHYAAANFDLEVTKYLISLGADVNIESDGVGVTPLWFIARNEIEEENIDNAREIAKILLDSGAAIDIKNKNGVALYNKRTDKEIEKLILAKYPNAQMGPAPMSKEERAKKEEEERQRKEAERQRKEAEHKKLLIKGFMRLLTILFFIIVIIILLITEGCN